MDISAFWATYNTLIYSIGVQAILALSIYLTLSCGLLSLGNAAFMGIGAYASAIITMNLHWPFPLSLLAGSIAAVIIALIIGIPVLRLTDVYLAIATLGFGEVVRVILLNMEITGGPMGLNNVPMKTQWWHILILLAFSIYFVFILSRSKIGRAFEAIKEDATAASLMGINTSNMKLLAFVLGAFFAGLAGGLNAHFTSTLSPNEFGFSKAVDILTMAVLGGTTSFIGPMIGSTILTLLPELLRFLKEYRMVLNGLILILIVLFVPNGIWDIRRIFDRKG